MPTRVSFYGQWDEAHEWLREYTIDGGIDDFEEALLKLGEAIKSRALWKIARGDSSWPALSPSTVARKGHSKFYVDTGLYINSIVVRLKKTGKTKMELTVSPEGTTEDGYDLQTIARYLELGTTRMPARPLWRPLLGRIPNIPEFREITKEFRNRRAK